MEHKALTERDRQAGRLRPHCSCVILLRDGRRLCCLLPSGSGMLSSLHSRYLLERDPQRRVGEPNGRDSALDEMPEFMGRAQTGVSGRSSENCGLSSPGACVALDAFAANGEALDDGRESSGGRSRGDLMQLSRQLRRLACLPKSRHCRLCTRLAAVPRTRSRSARDERGIAAWSLPITHPDSNAGCSRRILSVCYGIQIDLPPRSSDFQSASAASHPSVHGRRRLETKWLHASPHAPAMLSYARAISDKAAARAPRDMTLALSDDAGAKLSYLRLLGGRGRIDRRHSCLGC